MSSSPGIPWVHHNIPEEPQYIEHDEAGTAQPLKSMPTPTFHPLDTLAQSIVAAQ